MTNPLSIDFNNGRFVATGGDPQGKDGVYKVVTGWPGWRRMPLSSKGGSVYHAPPWVSSILPVSASPSLAVSWTQSGSAKRDELINSLNDARFALDKKSELVARAVRGRRWVVQLKGCTKRKPLPHQSQAIDAAMAMDCRCLLTDDMGLGKTAVALWCAHYSGASRLLVVCPVSVKFNWQREVELTLGNAWASQVIHGTRKQRADQLARLAGMARTGGEMGDAQRLAAIINYDLLIHLTNDQLRTLSTFVCGQFSIYDESHYLKNLTSQRSTLVRQCFDGARYRMLLTGTPVRNTIDDLQPQVELARPGTWTSQRDFIKRYCVVSTNQWPTKSGKPGRPQTKVIRGKNLKGLAAVMNTLQIRRKKEDVLGLPPKTYTTPELSLDSDTSSIYHAMKQFALIKLSELDPNTNVFEPRARSGVEAAMRCEQIAQGFIGGIPEPLMEQLNTKVVKRAEKIPGRPKELMFPNAPKVQWLLEAIESVRLQGGRPVVFSRFNAPMVWLHKHLFHNDVAVAFLHGGMDAQARDTLVQGFQEGHLDVLLCQVRIAEGFNLTNSQDAFFYGRDWSPAINRQAEDRLHRMGQRGTVQIQLPIVRDTVEIAINKRLAAKEADANQALSTMTVSELAEAL